MITNAAEWAQFTAQHPETHLLQTAEWGELKSAFGWQPVRLVAASCGAQILFRSLPGGFTLGYIPKGPLGTNWAELLPEIDAVCREHKAIFLKVEPDHWEDKEALSFFESKGWKHSHPIQPRRTIFVPIEGTEEQILASMKQKTRYNVHLAEKKGIQVHLSADIAAFQRMETKAWTYSSGGAGYTDWDCTTGECLPGNYEVQIFVGSTWKSSGTFTISGGAAAEGTATVTPTLTPSAPLTTPTPTP